MIAVKEDVKKEYFTSPGSHFTDEDAKIIGQRLEQLPDATIGSIVEDGLKKGSPIAKYFPDKSIASQQYYRILASNMRSQIKIRFIHEDKPVEVKQFHKINIIISEDEDENVMMFTPKILNDEDYAVQLISEAERELKTWHDKWVEYGKVYPLLKGRCKKVFNAIEQL